MNWWRSIGGCALAGAILSWGVSPAASSEVGDVKPQQVSEQPLAPTQAEVLAPGKSVRMDRAPGSSLYSEPSFQSLTSDRRLFRVGDLVTVQIAEVSSASTSAGTGAQRDSNVGVNANTTHLSKRIGLGTNNDFSGQGSTQRAGRVLGQLTVTVQSIAPNQDLMIAGEQWLEINGEKQMIRLEGRVRSKDINELNAVLSTRVADARIAIVGDGAIADKQKPSWWQQILTFFGV